MLKHCRNQLLLYQEVYFSPPDFESGSERVTPQAEAIQKSRKLVEGLRKDVERRVAKKQPELNEQERSQAVDDYWKKELGKLAPVKQEYKNIAAGTTLSQLVRSYIDRQGKKVGRKNGLTYMAVDRLFETGLNPNMLLTGQSVEIGFQNGKHILTIRNADGKIASSLGKAVDQVALFPDSFQTVQAVEALRISDSQPFSLDLFKQKNFKFEADLLAGMPVSGFTLDRTSAISGRVEKNTLLNLIPPEPTAVSAKEVPTVTPESVPRPAVEPQPATPQPSKETVAPQPAALGKERKGKKSRKPASSLESSEIDLSRSKMPTSLTPSSPEVHAVSEPVPEAAPSPQLNKIPPAAETPKSEPMVTQPDRAASEAPKPIDRRPEKKSEVIDPTVELVWNYPGFQEWFFSFLKKNSDIEKVHDIVPALFSNETVPSFVISFRTEGNRVLGVLLSGPRNEFSTWAIPPEEAFLQELNSDKLAKLTDFLNQQIRRQKDLLRQ